MCECKFASNFTWWAASSFAPAAAANYANEMLFDCNVQVSFYDYNKNLMASNVRFNGSYRRMSHRAYLRRRLMPHLNLSLPHQVHRLTLFLTSALNLF